MEYAQISAVSTYFPDCGVSNEELESQFEDFTAEKIFEKTGIRNRKIAGSEECASDLAVAAAESLFSDYRIDRSEVDSLILCTQTPDYFLPTTSCLIQERLGLSSNLAAFDVNLGCSGYIYCLGIAKGLIESGQVTSVLVLNSDTYSKLLHPEDRNVRSIFGDAAAATLVQAVEANSAPIGPFVYGTDGRGKNDLLVKSGAFREPSVSKNNAPRLFMDGPKVFQFTIKQVPKLLEELCKRSKVCLDDVDSFVFHQANRFMLEHLRDKLGIPKEKFPIELETSGNTVSASIPIALESAVRSGRLHPGMKVALVGFGVGFSWGATLIEWGKVLPSHDLERR